MHGNFILKSEVKYETFSVVLRFFYTTDVM